MTVGFKNETPGMWRLWRQKGLWKYLYLGVFAFGAVWWAWEAHFSARAFEREGVVTEARVVARQVDVTVDENGDETRDYVLRLAYGDGQEAQVTVSESRYNEALEGGYCPCAICRRRRTRWSFRLAQRNSERGLT